MASTDSEEEAKIVAEVSGWFKTAFPDRTCTKCGNKNFYVLDPPPQPLAAGELTYSKWPVTKIACTRCGFIEEHLTGVLKKALEKNNFQPL